MPHIIVEHSANLADLTDIDALVSAVHAAALDDGLPALDALRTRAAPRDHYRIADGDPAYGFVYLTARIGPGREPEAIQRFLTRLIDTVDEVLAPHQTDHPVAISAEVQLIDPTMRINRNHIRTHLIQPDR
jgi:5-carboxymethyl-2-hydroxymuconate isomerase